MTYAQCLLLLQALALARGSPTLTALAAEWRVNLSELEGMLLAKLEADDKLGVGYP